MKKKFWVIVGFVIIFLSGCQGVSKEKVNCENKVIENKKNSIVSSVKVNVDNKNVKKNCKKSKDTSVSNKTSSEFTKDTFVSKKPTVENSIASDLPVHIKPSKELRFDIVEDDKYIYCSSEEGISKIDKKTGKYKIILKQANIKELTLCGDYLYFIHSKVIYEDEAVVRIDKNGKNCLKVFNDVNEVHNKYVGSINHLKAIGNTLYMDCSMIVYSYNMETKEVRLVVDDANQYEIAGNNIYYIEHAQRTFTIYKRNLKNMKTKIILGNGKSEPEEGILYRAVTFIGDKMYYYTSRPFGVYCYKDGKSTTVSDKNMSWINTFLKYKGDLYYIEEINDTDSKIMKVNTKNNTSSQVAVLKDYSWGWQKIVNGYLYYYTREDEMKSLRLR